MNLLTYLYVKASIFFYPWSSDPVNLYLINYPGDILSLYFIVSILFIKFFTFYDTFISDGNFSIVLSIKDTSFGIELYSYGQIP